MVIARHEIRRWTRQGTWRVLRPSVDRHGSCVYHGPLL